MNAREGGVAGDAMSGGGTAPVSRYALVFIFVTMPVDTIGLGLIIPVAPKLIAELTGQPLSNAARCGGWLFFTFALMQFLFAPVVGNLSDRLGRRPVLILALVALAFDYALTGWAPTIWWLFIGRALSGAAGSTYPIANAYIADVSRPRSARQTSGWSARRSGWASSSGRRSAG
jgi:DHA1 family tetracycline resistance protein-like MFS transporter